MLGNSIVYDEVGKINNRLLVFFKKAVCDAITKTCKIVRFYQLSAPFSESTRTPLASSDRIEPLQAIQL